MNRYTAGVLTASDSVSQHDGKKDISGPLAADILTTAGFNVIQQAVVPDEKEEISAIIRKWADEVSVSLIITTGGTGLFPRDVTPEATKAVIEHEIPGIQEAIRAEGMKKTHRAMLSRGIAGIRGATLVINLPGNPAAVSDGLNTVLPVLGHAIDKIQGDTSPCGTSADRNIFDNQP